jgi:tRNA-2-methylthio-N6-dimethylallyladenosine synthase
MAESSVVCEHLHLPVQSGSTRVLKEMKRSYNRARYLEKVAMARSIVPGLALTTDIIVGFPGETDGDFEETLSLVEEVRFDAAYTFQYSPRPGTEAGVREDQVPKAVVQERFDRLVAAQERISYEHNRAVVGSVVEVLVEGPSKKDPDRITGRTRTNKLVHFAGTAEPGAFLDVLVTGAAPHHLEGEVLVASRASGVASPTA